MALTAVHVTHEATEHMGGIGTVLEGLVTSPVYQRVVERNIFVGTLPHPDRRVSDPRERLGEHATECYYSGADHYDPVGMGAFLRPIEWAFDVHIVYGMRLFADRGDGTSGRGELLLIDVANPSRERLGAFKWFLHSKYHVDSLRYEHDWSYEEWCRLAEPAYHALCALFAHPAPGREIGVTKGPAVVLSHEFMGVCTALRCAEDRARFRTVFHAHECSTARRIVEHLAGKDVAFYPALRAAAARGRFIGDVFGDQHDFARHALVANTHRLDAVLAVGDETAEELRFLSPEMSVGPIVTAYNGLPAPRVSMEQKRESRVRVLSWLEGLLGFRADYLITHVTRPVVSKGLWRDHKVCTMLGAQLREAGKRGVYLLLANGAPIRSEGDARRMRAEHNWPARHTIGYPDLDGPEVEIHAAMMDAYGAAAGTNGGEGEMGVTPVFVNQFGFTGARLGVTTPTDLSMVDLRRAADVELGMSVYEPYGIAHLEALHAGAICVPSSVCGCLGSARRALGELGLGVGDCPILLPADFTIREVSDPRHFTAQECDEVENEVCSKVAQELARRLARDDAQRAAYLELGQKMALKMGWDEVCARDILPVLERITR